VRIPITIVATILLTLLTVYVVEQQSSMTLNAGAATLVAVFWMALLQIVFAILQSVPKIFRRKR
jgi:uncharacterized membrane protein